MNRKRITFVQVGNYAEGFKRFAAGGGENFYAQRYSVDFVGELAGRDDVEQVSQVCIAEDLEGEEVLPNGVHQLGLLYRGPDGKARARELIKLVMSTKPTHLIINSPITSLIRHARNKGVDVFPLLADSFRVSGIKAKIRYAWLAHNLEHPKIRWVTNRNLKASQDLERIGIPPSKIVPFDWPAVVTSADFEVKTSAADPAAPRLLYVGQVRETKGVGDLIDTVVALRNSGKDASLTIVGAGNIDRWQRYAAQANVGKVVNFAGKLSHADVLAAMHDHDVVLVPSRHEYPEGMPNVIYEGLCSRTPLAVSDHPMFGTRVKDGQDCLVFPAGRVPAIVEAVEKLLGDPALYEALSRNAEQACDNYLIGAPWGELIEHWLGQTAEDDAWLADHALTAPRFNP
ncbi:MAG: glycosyltransferase family 4 protein [Myxococcota bacterium]|jgi:glycosyltransferase involved in cell wall biosynthesis|nr:glycosyltransferase family 4 protein [Myxococcota bacterium]